MGRTEPLYRVWWDEEAQVAHADWRPGSACGLEQARAITAELRALDRGSVPVLVDMRGLVEFERAGREHFIADDGGARAVALLVASAVDKMIANFFIGMKRLTVPIRMFTDQAAALDWLGEHR
jgi:hypothetical protein